jgi:signal transduction histidine kinase
MEFAEVRHLDGIRVNFATNETEYIATSNLEAEKPLNQIIYSNVKEIVQQQHFVFDSFWVRAIPAEKIIKEIESGIKETEFFEVTSDTNKASQIYVEFIRSIEKEALLLLPESRAVMHAYDLGIFDVLIDAAVEKKSEIKIICPIDNLNSKIIEWVYNKAPTIKILNGDRSASTVLIVDDKKFFRAESKIFEINPSNQLGFAVYSNSRPSVESFRSFFELLWGAWKLNEELKRIDSMQKEFIAIAAHEIRAPIQPILGISQLLGNTATSEQQRKFFDIITRNAERLRQTVENVLDITRIESHSLKLHRELFNLWDVIKSVVDDIEPHIRYKKIKIQLESHYNNDNKNDNSLDEIIVYADKDRITQVILNLLYNAMKFVNMPVEEEESSIITISLRNDQTEEKHPQNVVVSIRDGGTGIESNMFPRLFTKYNTTSSNNMGTGLGLYICRSIIEAHGGKIWAENNPEGKGATFTFALPLPTNTVSTVKSEDVCI